NTQGADGAPHGNEGSYPASDRPSQQPHPHLHGHRDRLGDPYPANRHQYGNRRYSGDRHHHRDRDAYRDRYRLGNPFGDSFGHQDVDSHRDSDPEPDRHGGANRHRYPDRDQQPVSHPILDPDPLPPSADRDCSAQPGFPNRDVSRVRRYASASHAAASMLFRAESVPYSR